VSLKKSCAIRAVLEFDEKQNVNYREGSVAKRWRALFVRNWKLIS
jgi:hypothetical protein